MDRQMDSIILAIDIGSSSIRCMAYKYDDWNNIDDQVNAAPFGVDAVPDCFASTLRPSVQPTTGKIRLLSFGDHNSLMDTVDSVVEQVLEKVRSRYDDESNDDDKQFRIVAVGFSSFVMNLVAVNSETGELLGDEFTCSYACNSAEAVQECERLKQQAFISGDNPEFQYQKTGAPFHTAYALPQLCALYKSQEQEEKRKTTSEDVRAFDSFMKWQTLASHCIAKWTGQKVLPISYSEASWTGLLNVNYCVYEERLLCQLPGDYCERCIKTLPELADYTECVHGIPKETADSKTNPYWDRFPQLRHAKFFLGVGDGACANIGSKCTTSDRIAVTIGTSAAARMCLRHPCYTDAIRTNHSFSFLFSIPKYRGLFCYRIDKDHVLVGGALTDGGSIIEWARNLLNLTRDEDFDDIMEQIQGTSKQELANLSTSSSYSTEMNEQDNDLLMVPFLSGERSTGFRSGATGAMLGLTRETTPATFLQSCFEGVAFRLRAILDLIVACRPTEDSTPATTSGIDNIASEDLALETEEFEFLKNHSGDLPNDAIWGGAEIAEKGSGTVDLQGNLDRVLHDVNPPERRRLFQFLTKVRLPLQLAHGYAVQLY
jgi:gluconokinase